MEQLVKAQNEVQLFENEKLGSIRTVTIDGNPWFIAKDVCDILDITNPTMSMQQLEDFERSKFNLGRQGEANIINESGFYTLVLRSRKPIAKPFRIWVTSEVLPSIRKIGSYSVQNSEMENKLDVLLSEITQLKEMHSQISDMETIINNQAEFIEDINEFVLSNHDMLDDQKDKLEMVVDNMTLSTRQQEKIHEFARKRVNHLLGGAHSAEYKKHSKLYFANLWNNLKERFHCGSSWKDLNPVNFDDAIDFIRDWNYA